LCLMFDMQLELENLRLKRENDELSAEVRIAIESYGYQCYLDCALL